MLAINVPRAHIAFAAGMPERQPDGVEVLGIAEEIAGYRAAEVVGSQLHPRHLDLTVLEIAHLYQVLAAHRGSKYPVIDLGAELRALFLVHRSRRISAAQA